MLKTVSPAQAKIMAALRADLAILTMTGTLDARPKVGYVYLGKNLNADILENISKIKVGDIMSKPITVSESTTVYDAIVFLFLHDVGTLFVENDGAKAPSKRCVCRGLPYNILPA